ncbi:hypothetical protein TRICI_000980 [Trichomonascus ciferrii]|uniref:GPI inositol-deacylase n=1 Tax=Trichomonascus ciferrii TaxID=44093 RepID=A0A642VAK9_9ASCO|nr:hypothetical protein TRICI_000980 [Trichomonascus ciferrii]
MFSHTEGGSHVSNRPNVENLSTAHDTTTNDFSPTIKPNVLMSIFDSLGKPNQVKPLIQARRSSWYVVWSLIVLSIAFIVLCSMSFLRGNGTDVRQCRMSYMTPSYTEITGFDGNYTRFASKYSLFLYRERYLDTSTTPSGVPVIFIPGNAGSYRQVRAIAAECAHQFYNTRSAIFNSSSNSILSTDFQRGLDFFTADFGEDLTAFHGKTLLDQAEYLNEAIAYILSMYKKSSSSEFPAPSSVILIGHSMGGMVARTMVTLPSYRPNTVNTILTLAAPHSMPPVSVDRDVVQLYEGVNRYWEKSFSQELIGRNPLASVVLISIAGGKLDQMISSDHASVAAIVPPTNGFTVYTSSIPFVWSGIDHQAIVWCDQFRQVIARSLMDALDVRNPSKTKTLASRMDAFRRHLLTGFEPEPQYPKRRFHPTIGKDYSTAVGPPDTVLIADDIGMNVVPNGQRLHLDGLGSRDNAVTHLMPLPSTMENLNDTHLSLLSNRPLLHPTKYATIDMNNDFEDSELYHGIYMLACKYPNSAKELSDSLFSILDLRKYTSMRSSNNQMTLDKGNIGLMCKNIGGHAVVLPQAKTAPPTTQKKPQPVAPDDEHEPMYYANFNSTLLSGYSYVVVVDTNEYLTPGFVLAENRPNCQAKIQISDSLWKYFVGWKTVEIPANSPIEVDASFESLWSSLLAYRVKIGPVDKKKGSKRNDFFTPFMRQYIQEPFESKYYLNLVPGSEFVVNVHGVAPFTPYSVTSEWYSNLHLQVWNDGTGNNGKPMEIQITVDIMNSLGQLVLHYRTALCILPIFIVVCVLMIQLEVHAYSAVFLSFEQGLRIFTKKYLWGVLILTTLLPMFLTNSFVEQFFYYIEPMMDSSSGEGPSSIFTATRKNQFFLGLESTHLCFLGPLFILVSTGLNFASYYVLMAILHLVLYILKPPGRVLGTMTNALFGTRMISLRPLRIAIILALLVGVVFILPQQLVFMVGSCMQLGACVKAIHNLRSIKDNCSSEEANERKQQQRQTTNSEEGENLVNYAVTVLIAMLWIVPINAPVLAVWIRNLSVSQWWQIPFGSNHDVLSIAPLMMLVEKITSGKMLPRINSVGCSQLFFTRAMLLYIAFYCLIFGIQRAYWLHNLVNFFAAWLVVIYIEQDLEDINTTDD